VRATDAGQPAARAQIFGFWNMFAPRIATTGGPVLLRISATSLLGYPSDLLEGTNRKVFTLSNLSNFLQKYLSRLCLPIDFLNVFKELNH
jgi:hypothetical protein